eukprot:61502-Chlamydomonas_euryale.AAC.1
MRTLLPPHPPPHTPRQALVRGIAVPPALLDQLRGSFHEHAMLVLRSSANVEDLAGMSAAGLYESVVGVPVADADGVAKAIAEVWASLYTRRAVLSRRCGWAVFLLRRGEAGL